MKCLREFKEFFEHSAGFRLFEERKFRPALEHLETEIQKTTDRRVREYARLHAAKCYYVLGQYPQAKRYLIQSNKWAGNNNERALRMACVFILATLEVAMGNREKGLSVFEKFRSLYESRLEPYDRGLLLLNLALTHTQLKQLDQAEAQLEAARPICEELDDTHLLTNLHVRRGVLANRRGDFSRALKELELAAEIASKGDDPYDQTRCYWQIGNHYIRQERFDHALRALKKAIRVAKRSGYQDVTAKCLNDYAWAHFRKGHMAEAKSYAEEAILTGREAGLDTSPFLDTLEQINAHINDFYEEEKLIAELERESAREFELVGYSDQMVQLTEAVKTFAPCVDPVLITGETGTGKELVARALHQASNRSDRVFVKRNCSAIPENLIESELFGHVKGAFTGATTDRKGIFEEADGGTLFLDEIGEMPMSLQSKLLRVLEYGEFYRVGSTELLQVDVRLITATNKNLQLEVSRGSFREDLYFRLNTIRLDLPPLRDRREDITMLVNHFLFELNEEFDKYYKVLSDDALQALESYAFPGNVRELKNIIRAAYLTSKGRMICATDLSRYFQDRTMESTARSAAPEEARGSAATAETGLPEAPPTTVPDDGRVVPFEGQELLDRVSLKQYVMSAEKKYLLSVLRQCDSVNKACAVLKISRPTFYQKLKVHEISLSSKRLV